MINLNVDFSMSFPNVAPITKFTLISMLHFDVLFERSLIVFFITLLALSNVAKVIIHVQIPSLNSAERFGTLVTLVSNLLMGYRVG